MYQLTLFPVPSNMSSNFNNVTEGANNNILKVIYTNGAKKHAHSAHL